MRWFSDRKHFIKQDLNNPCKLTNRCVYYKHDDIFQKVGYPKDQGRLGEVLTGLVQEAPMHSNKLIGVVLAITVLGGFLTLYPNPVDPRQYVVLSEVQVVDPAHWTVEFLYSNKFQSVTLPYDTYTNDFSLVNKSIDTSVHPKIPVNKNCYGLITPQQYPTLRFYPGDTVRLQWNHFGSLYWECIIDSKLKPTQSMSAYQYYFSGMGLQPPHYYIQWNIDASPTLGFANDSAGIYGVVKGYVCNKEGNGIPNAAIGSSCSIFSDKNGYFYISNLSYATVTLTIAGKTFGPFTSEPGCTTNVTCKIDSSGPVGTLFGFACDKDSQPLINSWIFFRSSSPFFQREIFTDSSGHFILSLLPAIPQLFLSVGDMISGPQDYGPFSITPGCTTNAICKTPLPVSAHKPVIYSPTSTLKIVGITKANTDAIIVFNSGDESGDYEVAIFSMNGKRLYSSTVSNSGPGTYSVSWNSAAHSGTFIARLRSQSTSVEKRFTIK